MSDQQISNLFREAAEGDTPEATRVIRGGVERGQALRRRRRIGTSLAAAAMVGVVGFAASVGPGLLSDDDDSSSTGGVAADPTSSTSSAPTTTATKPPKPKIAVKANQIPDLVTKVVPGPVVPYKPYGGYLDAGDEIFANFQLNGMLVSAGISKAAPGDPMKRCMQSGLETKCVVQPDGSVLQTGSDSGPVVDGGVASRGAFLYLPRHDVSVMSYNAATAKDSPVLQAEPPITDAQLKKIVTQDGWVTKS